MTQIDLITGFLGSGKTTFIKKYAAWLIEKGYRIGILENDMGAVNVDMMLLNSLEGDQCELEMISGGCDQETHRRRFRTKLIAMGMCGYDRVLIEPSGVFDMDEFFDLLHDEPLDQWYTIGNVIAIADAGLEDVLSDEADYVLASEAACAGRIVLSRTKEVTPQKAAGTVKHIEQALQKIKCGRSLEGAVVSRGWDTFTDADFEELSSCGYVNASYVKRDLSGESGFESKFFLHVQLGQKELEQQIRKLMKDPACGTVFRIKGFFRNENGGWMELNATKEQMEIRPSSAGQEVLIAVGEGLHQEAMERYLY